MRLKRAVLGLSFGVLTALVGVSYTEGIWARINPGSLQEYLSFIQLYPDSYQAQLAKERLQQYLGIPAPELSEISTLGTSLVDRLLLRPESSQKPLSDDLMLWVESVASRELVPVTVEGRNCQTLNDLEKLDVRAWDITQVAYLCSNVGKEYDESQSRQLHAKVDMLAICAKLALKSQKFASNDQRDLALIEAINKVIFDEQGFAFPSLLDYQSQIDAYTSLPSLIDSKKGVCLGVSILYMALAQRLGLELTMVTPPGHIYLRWASKSKDPEIVRNIETTAYGMHLPDLAYRPLQGFYLVQRHLRELPGLIFINQASVYLGQHHFNKASQIYEIALRFLDPEKSFFIRELGAYASWLANPGQGIGKIHKLWYEYKQSQSQFPCRMLCFDPLLLQEVSEGIISHKVLADHFRDEAEDLHSQLHMIERLHQSQKLAPKSQWLRLQIALAYWRLGRMNQAWNFWPKDQKLDPQRIFLKIQLAMQCAQYHQVIETTQQLASDLEEQDRQIMTPFYRLEQALHERFFALKP